jgi:hypothetical protein
VGRENHLQSLEKFMQSDSSRRMTIYGLGGSGKSSLALEFAYRVPAKHPRHHIFWVPAINQQSFELAFREIGARLNMPGVSEKDVDIKKLVKDTLSLETIDPWLMIVDNADDPGIFGDESARLQDHLPSSNNGKIIYTSRS